MTLVYLGGVLLMRGDKEPVVFYDRDPEVDLAEVELLPPPSLYADTL